VVVWIAVYPAQYDDESNETDFGADDEELELPGLLAAGRLFKTFAREQWPASRRPSL